MSDTLIYTHPDCAYSSAAKMDYRKRKVQYTEIDLSKKADQIPALLELTNGERVTPVIVENGVVTIDAGYIRQGFAASHLILERGHAVFVETGTSHSVRDFLEVLENEGIPRENVDFVMVTHVHLDHAGGAGALIRE